MESSGWVRLNHTALGPASGDTVGISGSGNALTLAASSVGLWLSSDTSGAVGTDTGSKGDLAFPASPREAVFT